MKLYTIKRLLDGKVYKMVHSDDAKASELIGEFIRKSEIKSIWKVVTHATSLAE